LKTRESELAREIARLKATEQDWRDLAMLKGRAGQNSRQAWASYRAVHKTRLAREQTQATVQAAAKELEMKYPDLKAPPVSAPRSGGAARPARTKATRL